VHNIVEEALAGVRLQRVGQWLNGPASVHAQQWALVLQELRGAGSGVVPQGVPRAADVLVMTYPLDGVFGPLLEAVGRFLVTGGQAAAEDVADQARVLKALTVAPALRHFREAAPASDAPPEALLSYRIGSQGNGFLALSVAELAAAGGTVRTRGLVPCPQPADPAAFVVLWDRLSAPGHVLAAAGRAHSGEEPDMLLLHQTLAVAATALVPGDLDHERL
jgi:hypothetical protein